MTWSEGHLWKIQFIYSELAGTPEFEYKFIIKRNEGRDVHWEGGSNRKYDYHLLYSMLAQEEIIKRIEESNYDVVEVMNDKFKVSFDRVRKALIIYLKWQ